MAKQDKRKIVISCEKCGTRVDVPLACAELTFNSPNGHSRGRIVLNDFIAMPPVLCKKCLGTVAMEIIDGKETQKPKGTNPHCGCKCDG